MANLDNVSIGSLLPPEAPRAHPEGYGYGAHDEDPSKWTATVGILR